MEIADDITAVRRRIAQICGDTLPDASSGDAFGIVLSQRVRSSVPYSRLDVEALARQEGARYGVDPALIQAIAANESGFDPAATSPVGAQGLMQLMPSTAHSLGVSNAYDPAQNVAAGTRYLRGLLDRFKRVDLAVAAYNAGPNVVARYRGIPPIAETQAYVREVLADYHRRLHDGNVPTNGGSQRGGSIVP